MLLHFVLQTHRAFMIASLIFGVIGFIFAFIAHARNTQVAGIINFDTPHVRIESYNAH